MNPTRYGRSSQQGNLDAFGVGISVGRPGMNGAGHVHEMLADAQSVRGQCAPKASHTPTESWHRVDRIASASVARVVGLSYPMSSVIERSAAEVAPWSPVQSGRRRR